MGGLFLSRLNKSEKKSTASSVGILDGDRDAMGLEMALEANLIALSVSLYVVVWLGNFEGCNEAIDGVSG